MLQVWDLYKKLEEEHPHTYPALGDMLNELERNVTGKILISARHYQCFSNWTHTVGINRSDPLLRYVTEGHQLRGYSGRDGTFFLTICNGPQHSPFDLRLEDFYHALRVLRDIHAMEFRNDRCTRTSRR
jgi:hypothetical protein